MPSKANEPSKLNPKVDEFLGRAQRWQDELQKLRMIVLDCGLTEELKWAKPCYTLQNRNVVILIGFKEYCALQFFKGALLKDADNRLVPPGKHSQAVRQIRFTEVQQIAELEPVLRAYIHEAIAVEKAGLQVEPKKTADFSIPAELQEKLDELPAFKRAFEALTPGRQRAYIIHFSAPKQAKTRTSRVEKYMPQILAGKGLRD